MIEKSIEALNTALKADPAAINLLFRTKALCNQALADHPTMICDAADTLLGASPIYFIRAIGVINGIIEPMTGQRIAEIYDDAFPEEIIGFCVYKAPEKAAQ